MQAIDGEKINDNLFYYQFKISIISMTPNSKLASISVCLLSFRSSRPILDRTRLIPCFTAFIRFRGVGRRNFC